MQRALKVANETLDQNPRLQELCSLHPELCSRARLREGPLFHLRETMQQLQHVRKTLRDRLADRKRPGFVYLPQVLPRLQEDANSVESWRFQLCRYMGAVVTADLMAEWAPASPTWECCLVSAVSLQQLLCTFCASLLLVHVHLCSQDALCVSSRYVL